MIGNHLTEKMIRMSEGKEMQMEPSAGKKRGHPLYQNYLEAGRNADPGVGVRDECSDSCDIQNIIECDGESALSASNIERKSGKSHSEEGRSPRQRRNSYCDRWLERMFQLAIRPGSKVLHVGCRCGDLLNAVGPSYGLGTDTDPNAIGTARRQFPHLDFRLEDPHELDGAEAFDYIMISEPLGEWHDVQQVFERIRHLVNVDSRVIIACGNSLWESALQVGSLLRVFRPRAGQTWLATKDVAELLHLADFEVISTTSSMMIPKRIPILSALCNHFLCLLPGFRRLNSIRFLVARPSPALRRAGQVAVSVIVPCKNERGNIAETVRRIPRIGRDTEIIFVDGNSTDGTVGEIQRQIQQWPDRRIRLIHQSDGLGKGDAVRRGFAAAAGDVLVIQDADLTVPPEELARFFRLWCEGKGDLLNGSRLVYPLEKGAMRFLNFLGNRFFSFLLTWLSGQRLSDTLCGTKMISKEHYQLIRANCVFPDGVDPFGDFDLILGAIKQHLKIVNVPVRYKARAYGETRISRFRHGWLLLRMSWMAVKRIRWLDTEHDAREHCDICCHASRR
jgi:2-polyprenyl-3-methyl-5-hydroxy-6-metoxy-1,4-benzoquinol methylase